MSKEFISQELVDSIEINSSLIDSAVKSIINKYSDELDRYVDYVDSVVRRDDRPPTDEELDDFILNLSTLIYYASAGCEDMGIRDDIAKSKYKEAYNNARSTLCKGTVADKNMQAELDVQEEHIVSIIYNKSYKVLKAKVESAQELLASCKKILSRRMSEYEITRMVNR